MQPISLQSNPTQPNPTQPESIKPNPTQLNPTQLHPTQPNPPPRHIPLLVPHPSPWSLCLQLRDAGAGDEQHGVPCGCRQPRRRPTAGVRSAQPGEHPHHARAAQRQVGPRVGLGGGVALGNLTMGGGRRVEGDGEQKGNGFKVILWLYDIERPRQPDSTQLNLTPHNLTQSNPTQPNSV